MKASLFLIITSILIGSFVVFGTYYYINKYESEEDCFVRMLEQSSEGLKLELRLAEYINRDDKKLNISIARTIISQRLDRDKSAIFMTYFDYCGIKY